MEDNIIVEELDFSEELYNQNIIDNDFSGAETESETIGDDVDANN